ncbi:uncharacterized protein EI97DRAFT_434031 [Westerdykella ornata]|uniref:MOSC domain-containing protein n=1 Tax=Westerdykella ornata TaxID=318751 RepID=A0A6A6JHQ3_WESOR|nr:uncharacterized protein EI97DRAFT_434031 [Westerdykella ornata]KAF2275623.1 hypothetical protein EI97DRAFT_434031 [Westerdykella ornata]
MSPNKFNVLDSLVDSVYDKCNQLGLHSSPLTIAITILVALAPFLAVLILAITQKEERLPPPAGCRKLGLQGPSNLSDQFSSKYSQGGDRGPSNPWKVKALFIYPVKSCRGIELEKSDIVSTGLKYDRQFTFAQYVTGLPTLQGKVQSEWTFITQRTFPRMAKVEVEMWVPDPEAPGYSPDGEWVQSEGCVVVRFPFTPDVDLSFEGLKAYGSIVAAKLSGKAEPMVEFRVPFNPLKGRQKMLRYKSEKLKIWKDTPEALNVGTEVPDEVMAKLKYTLGVANPMTLFRIDPAKYREVHKNAPKKEDVGFQTAIGMQDSYPMHIMNLASVHHVSSQLPKGYPPLSALRYRANVFFTGPPAFSEDDWKKARIGAGTYHISCRTTRCKLPNVDPETGIADRNEPSTTMREYRVIDQGSKNACLGMQVTPLDAKEIKVGDEIEVLERGEHYWLKE